MLTDAGAVAAAVETTVQVAADNAPVAEAGGPVLSNIGDALTLDASASYDVDGEVLDTTGTSTATGRSTIRVSTSDRGQTVENQLQPLQEAAGRLAGPVVAISATRGARRREKRPGLDALLKSWRPDRERASHKRSFSGEPQISSDCVLKPALQRPRTES